MRYDRPGWLTVATTGVIALVVSLVLTLSRPVELRVDGQRLISDVPPVTSAAADTVFIPLRPLGEALGADTKYDARSGEITVLRGDQTLRLMVGSTRASLNGAPFTLHNAPFRVRSRVMVGLNAVARAFGVHATYDKRTARVDVNTPGVIEAGAQPDTEQQNSAP
jgi:hypothetical protein